MALSASTVWEVRPTATANNVNGGGFVAGTGTDYTLQDAAQFVPVDLACAIASTTLTSATGGFTAAMVGNHVHINAAATNFLVGWYRITVYTNTNTVTIDRTACDGVGNASGGTGYVGGALSDLNMVGTSLKVPWIAGNTAWIFTNNTDPGPTFTAGAAVNYSAQDGANTLLLTICSYAVSRTETATIPVGTKRPTLAMAGNALTLGDFYKVQHVIVTGTAAIVCTGGAYNYLEDCVFLNTSATPAQLAFTSGTISLYVGCSFSSEYGTGGTMGGTDRLFGCCFYDSMIGFLSTSSVVLVNAIVDSCDIGVEIGASSTVVMNSTIRNCRLGFNGSNSINFRVLNSIFADCLTGANLTTASLKGGYLDYNAWYGNGTDVTNVVKGAHDVTGTDPGFMSLLTNGTAATTNADPGLRLTEAGKFSGVTTSDMVVIKAGTGATAGVYAITAVDGSGNYVDLDHTPGFGGSAITWGVVKGSDFRIGSGLQGKGFPGIFSQSTTVGQLDIGAVQRKEMGTASASATLAKETGAAARGGSGTCAKLSPTSRNSYGYWDFYVPATAATPFTLSFYWAKSAAGFNGLLKVSIWDTDQLTLKNSSESVDITTADTNYHQFSATAVTPAATGVCRVRLEIVDGSTTGFLYIDDITIA